jgi:TonB family protein
MILCFVLLLSLIGFGSGPAAVPPQAATCTDKVLNANGSPVNRKVRILERPNAQRTQAARDKHTEGVVILSVVFNASGKVTDITVVQALPEGLTEAAMKSAEHIRFEPALKDGCPVSVQMQIGYNFTSSN